METLFMYYGNAILKNNCLVKMVWQIEYLIFNNDMGRGAYSKWVFRM